MSPRPRNIRKVKNIPLASGFMPIGIDKCKEVVRLYYEEYEAIFLCDYEMKTQQEASESMGVSRPTLSRIYSSARRKMVRALVEGIPLQIEGGVAYTDSEWFCCDKCGFFFNNINPARRFSEQECPICHSATIRTSCINLNKESIMMKIAVPTRDNKVDDHFGHCEYYTIYTVNQEKQILSSETIPSPQGCGCKSDIAVQLQDMGVSVMLAGNMGQGALNVLSNHNIKVVRGCSGAILDVATDYLNGKITDSGVSCASHEHHHRHQHNHKHQCQQHQCHNEE